MKTCALTFVAVLLCMPFGLFAQSQEPQQAPATQQQIEQLQKGVDAVSQRQQNQQKAINGVARDVKEGLTRSAEKQAKEAQEVNKKIESAKQDTIDVVRKEGNHQNTTMSEGFSKLSRSIMTVGIMIVLALSLVVFLLNRSLKGKVREERQKITASLANNGLHPTPIKRNALPNEIRKYHEDTGLKQFPADYLVEPDNLLTTGMVNIAITGTGKKIFSIQFPKTAPCALETIKIYRAARISLGLPPAATKLPQVGS